MTDSADAPPGGAYDPGDLWTDLKIGLIFYTRLPIRFHGAVGAGAMARAARLNPVVGAIVGLVGAMAYALARATDVPPLIAGLLAVAATALFTGALHEDGLADSADGFGGGRTREQKLAIMADSRLGSFGALALILSVAIRASALAAINKIDVAAVGSAFILAHAAGRAVLPAIMAYLPVARASGLAASVGRPAAGSVLWALIGAVVIAILGLGPVMGTASLISAALAAVLVAFVAMRQIGGITGDVLGAAEQIVEAAVLVTVASFATSIHAALAAQTP